MKLTIGENIRTLRRANNMTQEQLADKLGVTYQSVSRWENSQVYPDIELIPAIAEIFKTSADMLLGMPAAEKKKQAEKLIGELCRATYEKPADKEKIVALLREMRRDFIGLGADWRMWLESNMNVLRSPEIMPELRLFFEAVMEKNPNDATAIEHMILWEDEERIDGLLKRYCTDYDISKNTLLMRRYNFLGDHDKFDPIRQRELFLGMDNLLDTRTWRDTRKAPDLNDSFYINTLQLNLLNAYCKKTPAEGHPISADGEVDCWVNPRLLLGIDRASCLSALQRPEEAFEVLEDTVSLLEKTMKITDKITLESSPFTPDIVWTAEEDWHNLQNHPTDDEERIIFIFWAQDGACYCIYPSMYLRMLTNTHGWEWFDPIRNDPRYQSYVDRIKALVVTRPKEV